MNVKTEFKLRSLCLRLLITSLYILIVLTLIANGKTQRANQDVFQDLPTEKDLANYVTSLEKVIDFFGKHKVYISNNVQMGLFMLNANLKPVLTARRLKIPELLAERLDKLINANDELEHFFRLKIEQRDPNLERADSKITSLMLYESTWPMFLEQFNTNLLKRTRRYSYGQLMEIYGPKELHDNKVDHVEDILPNPKLSDNCFAALGNIKVVHEDHTHICEIPDKCKKMLTDGDKFGYGLSHRILYINMARYARRCCVFSEVEDKELVEQMCLQAYTEAQYIVANNYTTADLLAEYMAVCGLAGHAQFLRRSWIKGILDCQTSHGCFADDKLVARQNIPLEKDPEAWPSNENYVGPCNMHFSSVVTATISMATRYILEALY